MQTDIADFAKTRNAMANLRFEEGEGGGSETEDTASKPDIDSEKNGILGYLETTSRATFLMPPRSLRSLPTPRPASDGA